MPKFTKITTGGHPAYRFEHDGQTFEAYRYASGAGAWNVDRIDGDRRTAAVRGKDTRTAAVAAVVDAPKAAAPDLDKLGDEIKELNADADELLADTRALGTEMDELEGEVAQWGAKVDELVAEQAAAPRRADELEHGAVVQIAGTVYTVHHTEPAAGGKVRVCLGIDGTVSYTLPTDELVHPAELPTPAPGTPLEFFVTIEHHVQARPRVFEDRFSIRQRGIADPIERFALPYRRDRDSRVTLEVRGWKLAEELEYIPSLNCMRGRVERTPVAYGNAGHWINACVVDPDAGVPAEAGYVAFGRCGAPLIETTDTPRGHGLCVGCTGDPAEMWLLRDRIGWIKDGGRPVKVLRALDHSEHVLMETETTDDKPRDWPVVASTEILLAPEQPATRDEITAGALVEAVVISNRPSRQQWRVDRAPWGDERSTTLSNGRGVDAVFTTSLRVLEHPEPEPVNLIDRLDAIVRSAAGVSGPGESPVAQVAANEPVPGTLVDPWTWLRRPAGEPCKHGFRLRPGATLTIPCEFGHEYGVFGDEGPIGRADCAVQAANDAAFHTAEDDGDTTYVVAIICPDHEEQRADSCEECFAEPDAG